MSDDLNILIDPELVEVISVGNCCTPVECTISEYISYTTNEYVNQTLSAHNISLSAHQDIRDLISRDNNILSAYAPLSGANFFGNISAPNLSGTNTGDQDLSPYALSVDLNSLSNSLSGYALQTFVTSSISGHNNSNTAHQDIRLLITSSTSGLSSYAPYNVPGPLAGNITLNFINGTTQRVSISNNSTIMEPINMSDGARLEIWITPTTTCNLSITNNILIPSDSTFTSPQILTQNKSYILLLRYGISPSKWCLVSLVGGY